jgi:hypothetical protein
MFIISAVLLYIAVSLLSRIRPNIHIPPVELERTVTVPEFEEEVEDDPSPTGEGSHQNRSRSRDGAPEDGKLRESVILLSVPED